MHDVRLATMAKEIAESVLGFSSSPLHSIYIHVEAKQGVYSVDVFDEFNDHLLWREVPREISRACYELWLAADADKKWKAAEIIVAAGKFELEFHYGDSESIKDIDPFEHMDALVAARYPGKSIHYPPSGPNEDFIAIELAQDGSLTWVDSQRADR